MSQFALVEDAFLKSLLDDVLAHDLVQQADFARFKVRDHLVVRQALVSQLFDDRHRDLLVYLLI